MTGPTPAGADHDETDSDDTEPVGSVAEEAFKLFRAMTAHDASQSAAGDDPRAHVCTATWCPVCQLVGFVHDNPAAIAAVSHSAGAFVRSLRDLVDTALAPQEEP